MVNEAEEFAEQDKKVKARIDARNQLETYCYNMKQVGRLWCHCGSCQISRGSFRPPWIPPPWGLHPSGLVHRGHCSVVQQHLAHRQASPIASLVRLFCDPRSSTHAVRLSSNLAVC
jgi:hypothetical protein